MNPLAIIPNGIVIGLVEDLKDPEDLGRVRVSYPNIETASDWARLVTPMAGKDRGVFFRPEVGDEVLIAYEHGDPRRPYVLGSLWSTEDPRPADDGDNEANNWRFMRSRSGHLFKLDDTDGAELIEIEGKGAAIRMIIDSANKKFTIECDEGDIDVLAKSGTVTVQADTLQMEANTVEIKSKGEMNIEASGTLTIKGSTVNIN